jgi:hypothetical protein
MSVVVQGSCNARFASAVGASWKTNLAALDEIDRCSINGFCAVSAGNLSAMKKRLPGADLPVRAKARGIAKDPPIADTCLRVDGPKPYGQRENRRIIVLNHPEDHRCTIPRCGADWGPAATHGFS